MSEPFDPRPVLSGLKDFQRTTVDHVFRRLYGADDVKRFLVADEVGLGKTLVARGLIAKAIEHLQREGIERIDVVYVCSNADIARQNISRLNVTGKQEFNLPTRLTLLPLYLRQIKSHGLNFVSFTPGTTFDLKSRGGMAEERALLYRLLEYAWRWRRERHVGVFELLRASAGRDRFIDRVRSMPRRFGSDEGMIDRDLADAFRRELRREDERRRAAGERSMEEWFEDLAERSKRPRDRDWNERFHMLGTLRTLLAKGCVQALEPDLVILDEFQRFRDLLDGDSEAAELAKHLFDQDTARVLLLSATPYKMYTLADERDEEHYRDFLRTARFLMGDAGASAFAEELRAFRHAVLDPERLDETQILKRKRKVERRLRRVMARTERLGVTADRNGMLIDQPAKGLRLEPSDLEGYLSAERVSEYLGSGEMVEYWKSGSYLLNFLGDPYKFKRQFRHALGDGARRAELARLLRDSKGLLPVESLRTYKQIDRGNARLRALMTDMIDTEAWRLLWMPPTLPDYQLGGPFGRDGLCRLTKRLVFSSWNVVPQVIATLMSYEAERNMMRSRGPGFINSPEARRKIRPLLRFGRVDGRLSTMSLFGLLYPSPALARLGDPRAIATRLGAAESLPAIAAIREVAREAIDVALRPITKGHATEGAVDEAWYWAAPLLLDRLHDPEATAEWFAPSGQAMAERWTAGSTSDDAADSLWAEHLDEARNLLADPSALGRVPEDLSAILAEVAVASPANCALRAFAAVTPGPAGLLEPVSRAGAAKGAWGFRSLFNVPEVMALVRGKGSETVPYWTKVIGYCLDGGLQAVLTEYVHILRESEGKTTREPSAVVPVVGERMAEALSIRAATYATDDIRVRGGDIACEPVRMRARFALRFGAQSLEDASELQRAGTVRTAFNSPFWPFVLATTSVGQEGLDFHQYCHAVVHWSLPANPVDLEQREGRVHRYKGHAVRKNLAQRQRAMAYRRGVRDPWESMFEAARKGRSRGTSDLVPYWIYEGDAKIERYVPALPLSREVEKLRQLKRSLAAYRLVFGQPRQEDLTQFILRSGDRDIEGLGRLLMLDLAPR